MSTKSTKKGTKSKTDLKRLYRKADDGIDYSDIPATTKEFWQDAKVYLHCPRK